MTHDVLAPCVGPITYGKSGPTAAQLTNDELLKRLARTEVVDRRWRLDPTGIDEKTRRGINIIHWDLFQEAVKRGLRRDV